MEESSRGKESGVTLTKEDETRAGRKRAGWVSSKLKDSSKDWGGTYNRDRRGKRNPSRPAHVEEQRT